MPIPICSLTPLRACEVQGAGDRSPFEGRQVLLQGQQVTELRPGGFVIQDPRGDGDPKTSDALVVMLAKGCTPPPLHSRVDVVGTVIEWSKGANRRDASADRSGGRTETQVKAEQVRVVSTGHAPLPVEWLPPAMMQMAADELARYLEARSSMRVGLRASGARFVAPSNPFGDYTVAYADSGTATPYGGVLREAKRPWLFNFRLDRDLGDRPAVNVGATLDSDVVGTLRYRAGDYQINAERIPRLTNKAIAIAPSKLVGTATQMTLMIANTFNLDPQHERVDKVVGPRDVDDDLGDGRFQAIATAVKKQANCPDVIALQEIQDSDGAEISDERAATRTYAELDACLRQATGIPYRSADLAPGDGDGGQPNAHIRCGFSWNPERVELVGEMWRIGEGEACFAGTRKPVFARFRFKATGEEIVVCNVHFASKRGSTAWNDPVNPGFDPREADRIAQAAFVRRSLERLEAEGERYVVMGDFNDHHDSKTVAALVDRKTYNAVDLLAAKDKVDYVHRGHSQTLSQSIVPRRDIVAGRIEYEILHGNELVGSRPGTFGTRVSDHGFSLIRYDMRG